MANEISSVGGNVSNPLTGGNQEDDLKFLREGQSDDKDEKEGTDEESEEESEEPTVDDSDDEESDETEDVDSEDDEDEDNEEEDDETEEPVGSLVTAKDLKAKYPDIFKKVPELRNVIYREQQFSGIFATPEQAQTASVDAETFREMESDLIGGNISPLLSAIKGTKGANFNKLASTILPAIEKLDEATYHKLISVPLKKVLRAAFAEGERKNNKNLAYSAQHLHDFIFDNMDLDEKTEFETEVKAKDNPEEEKYRKKLEELDQRDHTAFKVKVDDDFKKGIMESFLDKFDPDNTFSKWAKSKMVEDAMFEINKQLIADPRHMKNMELLWRGAKASGYNAESKSRIVNAALARARQVIPTVRQKIRSEALAKEVGEGKTSKKKFKVIPKESSNGNREKQRSRIPEKEKSDLDIIRGN